MTRTAVHNLTFHGIGAPPRPVGAKEAAVWLSVADFHATLDDLRGRGDIRVTFDDGNRSDVELALPALRERDMTATFFVVASRLDDSAYLGRDDLERLTRAGMTIGSHGFHHQDWRMCSDVQLGLELAESRRVLEAVTGRPVRRAAVPFGSYDRRVLAHARRHGGYQHLFTSDGGPARDDAWLQPRTTITSGGGAPTTLTTRPSAAAGIHRSVKHWAKRWR